MKKLVLLGDSIRLIGYGTKLPALAENEYEVWQPTENCRWSGYTFRMLHDHKDAIADADVIHWNNGIWDVCNYFGDGAFTPIDVYVQYLKRIAKRLLTITDKVIFATTTPVTFPNTNCDPALIEQYNAAAVEALSEMGVIINDLHSFVKANMDSFIKEDGVHLNELGCEECAKQVLQKIRSVDIG